MSTQPELLACPFCGTAPHVGMKGAVIACQNNDCAIQVEAFENDEEAARKSWNTRHSAPAQGEPEPSVDDQSYADLRASGGIFPEFYAAATAASPVAWQAEWDEGGEHVRQFYPDEETARRVKWNVASYRVGVTDPVKVTPLYAHPAAQCAPQPSGEAAAVRDQIDDILMILQGRHNLGHAHHTARSEAIDAILVAIASAPISPPAVSCAAREAIAGAFVAGADAVHAEWVAAHDRGEGPPRGDPSFGEAARDYALSLPAVSCAAREAIARIIDPDAWLLYDNANALTLTGREVSIWRVEPSLAKADAILALPAAGGEASKREADLREALAEVVRLHDAMVAPTPETVERWRSVLPLKGCVS